MPPTPLGETNEEKYAKMKLQKNRRLDKAQFTLLKLANNQFKSGEDRKNMIKFLTAYIEGRSEKNTCQEDWKQTKLNGQIKRCLSGINRENNREVTRYFLFTLMKSGTKHVEKCLSDVYGLERFTPSFDFETAEQSANRIKPVYYNETDFIFGESFLSYHLYPSIEIINDINRFKIKTMVLLRNPAQTIVSHYYYCLKHQFQSKDTRRPGEYFGPGIVENKNQIKTFLLTRTFPRACKFIKAWLNVNRYYKKKGSDLVNIFFHEDLVKNKDKFYKQLHKVVNIGEYLGENSLSAFEKLKNHNQRKGGN